jgi:hypothetical protein
MNRKYKRSNNNGGYISDDSVANFAKLALGDDINEFDIPKLSYDADEKLARQLQLEEANYAKKVYDDYGIDDKSSEMDNIKYVDHFDITKEMGKHFNHYSDIKHKKELEEYERKNREMQIRNIELDKQKLENDKKLYAKSIELDKQKLENDKKLYEKNLELNREKSKNYYDRDVYNRIYDRSIALVPNYYTYLQRKNIDDILQKLIKKELMAQKSEHDLEYIIRNLLNNKNETVNLIERQVSNPTTKTTRRKVSKTTRKTTRRKVSKPTRKTTRRKVSKSTRKKVSKSTRK